MHSISPPQSRPFRRFTKSILAITSGILASFAGVVEMEAKDRQHNPDSFEWHPERAPKGPVVVAVSLKNQTAAVYRNGVEIGKCEISTGKPGHRTPTGVFHILNKDADHRSRKYGNAPMPYSERLTWDGVALHAGGLPGYPSSHGCIHLPYEFSKKLFGITHKGTTVVVTNNNPGVHVSQGHNIQIQADGKAKELPFSWTPEKSKTGPVSLVYSEADKKLTVLRNGVTIGECPVNAGFYEKKEKGTVAFVCLGWGKVRGSDKWLSEWKGIGDTKSHHMQPLTTWFSLPEAFRVQVNSIITPGVVMVITDESVTKQTQSKPGFTVVQSTLVEKAK